MNTQEINKTVHYNIINNYFLNIESVCYAVYVSVISERCFEGNNNGLHPVLKSSVLRGKTHL
jgi:hypothetical protein